MLPWQIPRPPRDIDVAAIRAEAAEGYTCQASFAGMIGVSVRTLQAWECGRRKPSGPAAALLTIIWNDPKAYFDCVLSGEKPPQL